MLFFSHSVIYSMRVGKRIEEKEKKKESEGGEREALYVGTHELSG